MMIQISLLLICMLFSTALSLKCHQCVSASSVCTNQEISCPDQCVTATSIVQAIGVAKTTDINLKGCGSAEECTKKSMNLGVMKMVYSPKCCKTDFCNSETLQDLPKQVPNGKNCYTCGSDGCSEIMNCEGIEDRCITTLIQQGSNTVSMKGCVSKNLCVSSESLNVPGFGTMKMECCKGNLCNGAESFTLNFLFMIVPLLSSILFY
ncbi:phospholipase A2 inhibitor gamma subunit B-like isoform X1 [Hemibagrus wyckioides]|nr:phospholipase A2 inhibitor gamma subunit B-like isoform X1 [Hemibagrus wyckioides]